MRKGILRVLKILISLINVSGERWGLGNKDEEGGIRCEVHREMC